MIIVPVQNAEQNICVDKICPFCQGQRVIKAGLRKRAQQTIQQFKCQDCGRWFIRDRIEPYFEKRIRHSEETIDEVARLYRSDYGFKAIQRLFQAKGEYLSTTTIWEYLKKKSVPVHRVPILPSVDVPEACPLCQGTKIVHAGFRYRTRTMERLERKFQCKTCGTVFFYGRLPNSKRWKYPEWLMQFAIHAYQEPKVSAKKVSDMIKTKFNIRIASGNIRRWLVINGIPRKKPWESIGARPKPTEETKRKISQTLKGKSFLSIEARKRNSERMLKLWADPMFREQMSPRLREGWVRRKQSIPLSTPTNSSQLG